MAGYPRDFISIEQALKFLIKELGDIKIKEATNKSESWFRKCSDPQDRDKNILHKDSVKLDIAALKEGRGAPLITAHQALLDLALKDLNKSKKITSTLIDMGVRIGRLMEVTKGATDTSGPGGKEISQLEKEKIYKAIKDVEGKISDLKLSIAKKK